MQARAPDEGPSDTGIATLFDRHIYGISPDILSDKRLRAIAIKRNIYSTKTLVAAYNATTDWTEQRVLQEWLWEYVRRSGDCLNQQAVLEFSELANIAPCSVFEKSLLQNVVYKLCAAVRDQEILRPNFGTALYRALVHVDDSVYDSNGKLVVVAKRLLSTLSPEVKLSNENYAEHETTFLALHQALYLLHKISQTGIPIPRDEKRKLRRCIVKKEKEMDPVSEYYPVNFHFKALRQAVERFQVRDPCTIVSQAMWCGFLRVFPCLRNLTRFDVGQAAIMEYFGRLRQETVSVGMFKTPWFDMFRTLMTARLEASKDEAKLFLFLSECDAAMKLQQMMEGEDLKAIRFGILQEMRQLTSQTSSKFVREKVTMEFLRLTTSRAIFEEWFNDADIFTAFLEALYEIHKMNNDNQETTQAFLQMQQSCEGDARRTLSAWLGGDTMENKLQIRHQQQAYAACNAVFTKIAQSAKYHDPFNAIRTNIGDLKEKYLNDTFATVSDCDIASIIHKSCLC